MNPPQSAVSRTRDQWLATAHRLRDRHPELAAKITLARLTRGSTDPNALVTIAFTRAEYDRLLAREPVESWRQAETTGPIPLCEGPDQAIVDVEDFLGLRPELREG